MLGLYQQNARKTHFQKYSSLVSFLLWLLTVKCICTAGMKTRKIDSTASDSFIVSVGRENFFADL